MVIVAFPPGEKYAVNYTTLDQYDYGQILRIQGLKLPKTVEVHFSTQETGGTSVTRVGVTKDGVTDVLIPDSVLENGDTAQNYSIFAFVYVTDATSGKTEYRARLEVKARPKPEVPGGGDNPDIFHEAVLEVRKSAEKAEEAQRQAEGWAHGREDLPERAEDNAMYYAGKASEDAKKTAQDRAEVERLTESNTQMQGEVAKDLEEVKKLSSQAQTSATNAALSEQKSKEAATRAETAQAGAETAEDNAELAAQKTGQDKTAVEQAKKLVQQMGQEVLDNKNAVDKTVQDFSFTAQQALADVNNAGQTQTEHVQSAGTTAVENIENAQNTATRAVETAKTEAIKAVQTEGTTQTGNVTAEGEKQVQAVQTAAQEIVADREQIQKNKEDIVGLDNRKADAIVETASGNPCNISDSSGLLIKKLNIYGESTQEGTPTTTNPVPIVSKEISKITVTGKELEKQEITLSKSITLRGLHISSGGNATIDGKQYISDVIKDKDGIVGIEKCAKEITFDGTEVWYTWGKNPNGNIGFYFYYNQATTEDNYITSKDTLLSNYLQYVDNAFSGNGIGVNTSPANDDLGYIYIIVSLKQSDLKDVTTNELAVKSFKEFLSKKKTNGVPFTMICPLNIPIFEPLPQADQDAIKKIKTYYPNTVINTGAWTEIEYIADTKEFLLSQNKNLQKQILDIQNALISQKISGGGIKVTNSAKLPIVKLSVFGKSEQVTTTGAQLLNYYKLAELSPQYYAIEQGELKAKGSNNAAWTSVPEYGTLAAGTYTISGNNVEIRDASKNTVIATCTGDTFSKFTLNEDTAIKMKVGYGLDKYPTIVKAMLNKGDSKKPYEPYTGGKPSPSIEYPQEITNCGENGTINLEIAGDNAEPQTLIIPTPNGLLGLKVDVNGNYTDENGQQWICDEIDLARGKYVQRIRKIVLDGNIDTKHIGQHENGTKYLGITLQEKDYTLKASNMLCTRYIRAEWTNKNGYVYSTRKDTVFITDNRFTDSETTKKIIGEEKPVIIYPLLTPIETDLPPETISVFRQLHTNYPNTIISNNADAGMELTYTVDTQSYVDSKIAEVSTAIVQKGI